MTYGNYVVKLPVRQEDGSIKDEYTMVPLSDTVHIGFLPYTSANVLTLVFRRLGDQYGWGGLYHANDCSGMVKDIYSCFGFAFARNSIGQSQMAGMRQLDFSALSEEEKLSALDQMPVGSLLFFPGHIALYLGKDQGVPYVISAVGSFATSDMPVGSILSVTGVVVNDVYVHRKDGSTWLSNFSMCFVPVAS